MDPGGSGDFTVGEEIVGDEFLAKATSSIISPNIVVGSHQDGDDVGSVYVYNQDGTGEVKITASDESVGSRFGFAVATNGTKIVVGAYGKDSNTGNVYVYNMDGTGEIKLNRPTGIFGSQYTGYAVAISSDKIIYSVVGKSSFTGAVYVTDLDGSNESRIELNPSDAAAGEQFGFALATDGNKIVVGSNAEDNPDDAGAVRVFNMDGTGEVIIRASDLAEDDFFGGRIAIGNNKIVVGASGNDDDGGSSGSAYIYNLDGNG